MTTPIRTAVSVLAMLAGYGLHAAPTPVSGPLAATGDGLNSKWVQVDVSINPNSLAEAKTVLGLGAGDPGFVGESLLVAPRVDYADGNGLGGVSPDVYEAIPLGAAAPTFAVRFSGYLNVTVGGNYVFSSRHDDGMELIVGGDTLIQYLTDTGPTTTGSASVSLVPGLYAIEYTGWEQGGVFIQELSWALGTQPLQVIPQANLFTHTPVIPEASTWVAAGMTAGLLGFGAWRRRVSRG